MNTVTHGYKFGIYLRIERPINTDENYAKFLTSIQLIPYHLQIQTQKQKQNKITFSLFDNDNNINNNWNIITNQDYTILMNNDYKLLFDHAITNDLNIPLLIVNELNTHCSADMVLLGKAANRIFYEENAGGNSTLSEAFSYEIISKSMKNIILHKTEMQIKYWWNAWKKTDYIIFAKDNINNEYIKCAVSVTRAMKYFQNTQYTLDDAFHLLNKKLNTVNESFKGVLLEDEWQRSILHVFCQTVHIANMIHNAFRHLQLTNPVLCANTILFLTITNENCNSIYFQSNKNKLSKNKK